MKKNEEILIEIPNWKKYNPRSDVKAASWFRLDHNLFIDSRFSQLSAIHKLIWIYLLSEVSRSTGDLTSISTRTASRLIPCKINLVQSAILRLERLQLVKVVSRNVDVAYERTERTIRTNETDGTESANTRAVALAPSPTVDKPRNENHWLVDLWNENCEKLPKARTPVSASRLKKIQNRIRQVPDRETWISAIQSLTRSNFCNGANDRSWVATFDFLINPTSLDKILEGKYENRKKLDSKQIAFAEQAQRIMGDEL